MLSGYPGKRYYGGCKYIDMIERKAIENACMLFSCNYANVQPHSGSSANMAIYKALLRQEDKVLGMDLRSRWTFNPSVTNYHLVVMNIM